MSCLCGLAGVNWIAGLVVLLLSLFVGACTWFWRRDLILCGELLAVTSESGSRPLPLMVDRLTH